MTAEPGDVDPSDGLADIGSPDEEDLARGGASRFFLSQDGLHLHMREYGGEAASALPVVCLPGLARTALDFDPLALRLSASGRRVVALDYRGRGRSDRDRDWRNYTLAAESADIRKILTESGISRAIFVGVSRGGLHLMALAALPDLLHAAVLVDIGPVLERAGLERIRGYVGKLPTPTSWREAIESMRSVLGARFSGLSDADVEAYARSTLKEQNGVIRPRYDTRLTDHLAQMDLTRPLPSIWDQYDALLGIPLLAIRGQNSDLLSPETLAEMAARNPNCEVFTVPGQGHAPLLRDEPTLSRIIDFVQAADPIDTA